MTDTIESVEVELIRVVDRLRAMKLGGYACTMHDGSTVRIKIKPSDKIKSSDSDSWDERIAAWLRIRHGRHTIGTEVTIARVLEEALKIEPKDHTRADVTRAAQSLRRLGWKEGPLIRRASGRIRPWRIAS